MSKSRAGVYFMVILAMIFWGFSFVAYKIAFESFRPVSIVFFRLFVSIFFLFGFALLFKRLGKIRGRDQKWFLLMALFEPFFYFLGEAFGLTLVTATVGAVIIATIPLIVPFASYYLFRERLTPMNYAGLVISFSGVMLVIFNRNEGFSGDLKGVILMFLAVFSAVGYTMVVKKLADRYNPITITAYQSLYGMLMYVPLFLLLELPFPDLSLLSSRSLLAVTYLGVMGSGICFIMMTIGIRELGAARANVFANLIPVVAAILSFLLLGEAMPLIKILGIGIVVLGLLLSQLRRLRIRSARRGADIYHLPES